jgi:hypothetical protein
MLIKINCTGSTDRLVELDFVAAHESVSNVEALHQIRHIEVTGASSHEKL